LRFAVVVGDGDVISNAASAVSTSTAASGGSTSSTSTAPLLFVNHSQAPTPSDVLQQGNAVLSAVDSSFTTADFYSVICRNENPNMPVVLLFSLLSNY